MPTNPGAQEKKFFRALQDMFVGAKVEGESGFINLMRLKARYFEQGVLPRLKEDIDAALAPFPEFREELFDKLYSFFHRYFSESGSIYFRYTPLHQNVYERVYTDDRDVMLFWKTHMLYYVKTDRLFRSMEVEVEGRKFFFDVSALQHKKANEKRSLIYEFRDQRPDGVLAFTESYAERGRQTRVDEILRQVRRAGGSLTEESLDRACRIFERQSEVDYFLNKNARAFLREQFDLWLYQYVFAGDSRWTETRIRQLQTLKDLAGKIIDFISQFEDELVKVWNKPKFVLHSHYVITLDRLAEKDPHLIARLAAHPGIEAQTAEWRDLGMVGEEFSAAALSGRDLFDRLNAPHRCLPVDTKHFPDLESEIVSLFDHLDQAIDGWLIKSENYQALNSILHKFRERINCIYIDPPYNTSDSEIFYVNKYKQSSWMSMIYDRLFLGRELLTHNGILCVTIDNFEVHRLRSIIGELFDDDNILGIVAIKNNPAGRSTAKGFSIAHEYALFVAMTSDVNIGRFERTAEQLSRYDQGDEVGKFEWVNFRKHGGANARRIARPRLYYPIYVTEQTLRIPNMTWNDALREWTALESPSEDETVLYPINIRSEERTWKWSHTTALRRKNDLTVRRDQQGSLGVYIKSRINEEGILPSTWWDKSTYSATDYGTNLLIKMFGQGEVFSFPKSVYATADCIKIASNGNNSEIILDFFAGSGTTAHAIINFNREEGGGRKYILIEMADYFDSVLLPRIKKAVFCEDWRDGKASGGPGCSRFLKYFQLEQYEDALRRSHYGDADLFNNPYESPYSSYVFLKDRKMLAALELDEARDAVRVDLSRLYDGIDVAETLSCVTGKWIKRLSKEFVEFEDGSRADLGNPDWRLIKPLIWW